MYKGDPNLEPTGIKLTTEQIEAVTKAQHTPLMKIGGQWPESPKERVHRFALANGLPEIPGYYGADLETGEIIKLL